METRKKEIAVVDAKSSTKNQTAKIPFTVSARAALLIGRENIATSQGAVTELVKNAYDADASACVILFLKRHKDIPENLTNAEFRELSAVTENAHKFYTEIQERLFLKSDLTEAELGELDKAFNNINDLWIIDNGIGMSSSIIENRWMVIGTDEKEHKSVSAGGRALTGAKGIGRFALDKLGKECELFSGEKEEQSISHWVVDWGDFEGQNKVIGDVTALLETESKSFLEVLEEVKIKEFLPEKIEIEDKKEAALSFENGTAIRISVLNDTWDNRDAKRLTSSLEALLPPKEQRDFGIYVFDHRKEEEKGWIDNFAPDQFDYRLKANVTSDGQIDLSLVRQEIDPRRISDTVFKAPAMQKPGFSKEDFATGRRDFTLSIDQLMRTTDSSEIQSLKDIGPFEFTLYFFKLNNPTKNNLEKYPQKTFDVGRRKRWLENSGGIRLYRDQFRVRPYGEPNTQASDWLLLGQRNASSPAAVSRAGDWRVPPHQVAGTIHISKHLNPQLSDRSNREGIMNERIFSRFREIIVALIRVFEDDRSYIYHYFEQAYKLDNPDEGTLERGKKAAKKTQEKSKSNSSNESHQNSHDNTSDDAEAMAAALDVSEKQNLELQDELRTLRGMATLGTVLISFTHELKQIRANIGPRQRRLQNAIDRVIDVGKLSALHELEKPNSILNRISREDEKIGRWIDFALSSVAPKKRRRKRIKLAEYMRNLEDYWNTFLADNNFNLNIQTTDDLELTLLAHEIDLDSIFYNLIINSVEAMSQPLPNIERSIWINFQHIDNDTVEINYRDEGPGIPIDAFNVEEDIFLFGRTSKPVMESEELNGTGIGMWLVASIINDFGGSTEIRSRMGQSGFNLSIRLPLAPEPNQ